MNKKIGFISLGCPKNQVDGEKMLSRLKEDGYEICDDIIDTDAVIINTCAFIEEAKKEAIETILDVVSLKEEGSVGKIIVTGCLSERYKDEILTEIPEVDAVCGIGANGDIAAITKQVLESEKSEGIFPSKLLLPENGDRILTTPSHWAYLKIAEGCSNGCSYCIIPKIRGKFRSRPKEDIIEEAQKLALEGVKEIIIVAQDTTRYGEDIYESPALCDLIKKIAEINGIEWIRLLYCYPERITEELLELMAEEPKLLHYLDIPLQHANGEILQQMGRVGSKESLLKLIEHIRKKIPDITLRTSLIAGFPGESEEAFEELCDFVKEAEFDRMGCFAYSREEGTKAYDMPNQIDESTKQKRAEIINEQQGFITMNKAEKKIGTVQRVITEGYDSFSDSYIGRSTADAPEIDRNVKFTSSEVLDDGDIVNVKIFDTDDGDLIGKTV